jgi:hypothetical protein
VPLVWTDPATGVRVEKTYIFKRGSYQIASDPRHQRRQCSRST